jgi:hypothetical protein
LAAIVQTPSRPKDGEGRIDVAENTGNFSIEDERLDCPDYNDLLFKIIDIENGAEADEVRLGWDCNLCGCDMEGFALTEYGILILCDECREFRYMNPKRFKVVWNKKRLQELLNQSDVTEPR